ncbi:hypothetical protein G7Y79_00010g028910 [Physcia stellaris]|nr:hypothetical protein G7Y79_00010g028910 [Physcia stellaris]
MPTLLSSILILLSTTIAIASRVSQPSSSPAPSPTPTSPSTAPSVPVQPIVTYIPPSAPSKAPVTKIATYAGAGFENLAFRFNGQLLATTAFPAPLLFYIDPLSIRPPIVLHNFTALRNTVGITELAEDRFYVHGQGVDGGAFRVYEVDMRGVLGSALLPNGMTCIRRSDDFVLIADTILGGVWKFNVDSGRSQLVIKDPSMAGLPNKTEFAAFGINGLRVQNKTLFYCNSGAQTFYKMPIHLDGSSAGKAKLIASGIACDDFALDDWGFAYVASPRNALIRLDTRTGSQLVVAGDFNQSSSDIISASSARFGVGDSDLTSLYITTNGGAFVGAPAGSQGVSRVDVGDLAQFFGKNGQYR